MILNIRILPCAHDEAWDEIRNHQLLRRPLPFRDFQAPPAPLFALVFLASVAKGKASRVLSTVRIWQLQNDLLLAVRQPWKQWKWRPVSSAHSAN